LESVYKYKINSEKCSNLPVFGRWLTESTQNIPKIFDQIFGVRPGAAANAGSGIYSHTESQGTTVTTIKD